jgi:hypothetical protein
MGRVRCGASSVSRRRAGPSRRGARGGGRSTWARESERGIVQTALCHGVPAIITPLLPCTQNGEEPEREVQNEA